MVVGFGIRTPAAAADMAAVAGGIAVGSAIVSKIARGVCRETFKFIAERAGVRPARNPVRHARQPAQLICERSRGCRFGSFGRRYVPEALMPLTLDLEAEYRRAKADPAFWARWTIYGRIMWGALRRSISPNA